MASAEVLDFAALLAPIPGDKAGGESVRYSGVHDAIQEARREEDEVEQGEWVRETKKANWPAVIQQATETLTTKSKDVQVAVWLVEALAKRHGFAGLRDGLRLLRELHETFWEGLHPEVEDGDLEYRAGPIWWLNEKLPRAIKGIPWFPAQDGQEYSWLHWEEAQVVDKLSRVDAQAYGTALAEGKVTLEMFNTAAMGPPRAHYEKLFADVKRSFDECTNAQRVVDEKFGRDAPSLLGVKKTVEECRNQLETIVKKKRELEPDPVLDATLAEAGTDGAAVRAARPLTLDPVDRADALRRLAAIAEFFRRTEPHSPVSYLVQRAVRWGQMPLEDWLQEVIVDGGVLTNVRTTLGLK